MSDLIIDNDLDIFADPTPAPEDERNHSLKRELDELRVKLQTMADSAACEMMYPEMEQWCREWKRLTASLTAFITLARERNIDFQFTAAERQHGQTGNEAYDRFQQQISDIKEAAARQGEEAARTNLAAKEKRQTKKEKKRRTQKGKARKADVEEDAENENDVDAEEQDGENEIEVLDVVDAEEQGRPLMRSIRVRGARKIAPRVQGDHADAESMAVAAKSSEPVGKKKVHAVPCNRCAGLNRTCYRHPSRNVNVCEECDRLKTACSHAGKKHNASPTPTPTPPHQSSSTAKSGRAANAGLPPKVKATAPAPAPAGMGKVPPPGPTPSLSGNRRVYVEIEAKRKMKRKATEDSSEGESETGDEDAYLAGRLNGLNTFVTMFETALGALKKEVKEIDDHLEYKRRRRRR